MTAQADLIDGLRTAVRGSVITPADAGYDEARRVWNAVIDRRPAAIIRCRSAADVIPTVNFARDNRLPLAVRGGAHNVAGRCTCDDGIVIDFSEMKSIRVDPAAETVRAEPGLRWAEFDRETQAFGLATTGGSSAMLCQKCIISPGVFPAAISAALPEGTRSPAGGLAPFQPGTAHIALRSGVDVTPVRIRCDPPALYKGQKWYDLEAPFLLTVRVGEPVSVQALRESVARGRLSAPRAARELTAQLREIFAKELDIADAAEA